MATGRQRSQPVPRSAADNHGHGRIDSSAKGAACPRERAEPTDLQSDSLFCDLLSARRADAGK
jgi:hypothetical protein